MNVDGILSALASYPGLVPGVALSLGVGISLSRRAGRVLGTHPIHGFALLTAFGLAVSATLTPSGDALAQGPIAIGECDVSRLGLPSLSQVARAGEVAANILLFVPLGAAIGLLPRSRAKAVILVGAAGLPMAIEILQLTIISLGRQCQTGDVADNLTGATLGICLAGIAAWLRGPRRTAFRTSRKAQSGLAAIAVASLIVAFLVWPPATSDVMPIPAASPTLTPAMSGSSIRVDSVPALLSALADNAVGEIVVADGTYRVSAAASQAPDSLWIGGRFAARTRPVTIRAETIGGVVFDGGGADTFGGITFVEGAHHQTWDGFTWQNGTATGTGVIVFGGYQGLVAPNHITVRNATVTGISPTGPSGHAVYFSWAVGGPHDILIERLTVSSPDYGLKSAIHFYHSDAANQNAWNVTVRELSVLGTEQAIMLWDPTLHDVTIDTAVITDARDFAVRYESPGATDIVLSNISSTGSGSGKGFESSLGSSPPGVSFSNNSFR